MAEVKTLRTKIALLYKTYAEWNAVKDTYIPLKGEVCICEVPASTGVVVNEPAFLLKVGNGTQTFGQLNWLSALAADVYAWAKKENLDFSDLTDDFKQKIKDLISEKNTLYRIIEKSDEGTVTGYILQKSEDSGTTWVDAEGFIDLSPILAGLNNLDTKIDTKAAEATTGINEAKAQAAEATAKAKELYNDIQAIDEVDIQELFLEAVSVQEGQTVAEALANLGEDQKLVLKSTDVIAENLTIADGVFIDAQGATFSGNLTVAEGAVIKNAIFTGKVVIG